MEKELLSCLTSDRDKISSFLADHGSYDNLRPIMEKMTKNDFGMWRKLLSLSCRIYELPTIELINVLVTMIETVLPDGGAIIDLGAGLGILSNLLEKRLSSKYKIIAVDNFSFRYPDFERVKQFRVYKNTFEKVVEKYSKNSSTFYIWSWVPNEFDPTPIFDTHQIKNFLYIGEYLGSCGKVSSFKHQNYFDTVICPKTVSQIDNHMDAPHSCITYFSRDGKKTFNFNTTDIYSTIPYIPTEMDNIRDIMMQTDIVDKSFAKNAWKEIAQKKPEEQVALTIELICDKIMVDTITHEQRIDLVKTVIQAHPIYEKLQITDLDQSASMSYAIYLSNRRKKMPS